MEKELKAMNDTEIEETIAEAFDKLVGGCKCKLVSRSYANPDKAVLKIELTPITAQDIVTAVYAQETAEKETKK